MKQITIKVENQRAAALVRAALAREYAQDVNVRVFTRRERLTRALHRPMSYWHLLWVTATAFVVAQLIGS
jgi:hypothetical protein